MDYKKHSLTAGMLLLAASTSASAFTINLDYTYDTGNYFTGTMTAEKTTRVNLMNAAASYFEARITDDLLAINSGQGGTMTAFFTNPATGSSQSISDFSVAADTITVFVGARDLGGSLGRAGPGGYSASGSLAFLDLVEYRGETPGTDFGPWGGALTFNSSYNNWYFDTDLSDNDPIAGADFYSVAIHELGHILGIGTSDSWDALVSGTEFTGANSTSVFGGNVPLQPGGAHWVDSDSDCNDPNAVCITPEPAMDPTITLGDRKLFTDLDWAGLEDVGWDVAPIPLPPAIWMFASGLLGILGFRKHKQAQA